MERPWRGEVRRTRIVGPYDRGVSFHFCLYATCINTSVEGGAKEGYFVGSGAEIQKDGQKLWPDAEHSNSASNQAYFRQARYHGQSEDGVAFIAQGLSKVEYVLCTVEGEACKLGWSIEFKHANAGCSIKDAHIEVPLKTAIYFDGYNSVVNIDGLRFSKPDIPEVLLDCRGDQWSTVNVTNNTWPKVPPILAAKDTKFNLFGNTFSDEEFYSAIVRPA